jgi:hypothetical protein
VTSLRQFWRNGSALRSKQSISGVTAIAYSTAAHRLQTTLTPAQEAVAVALRTTLLVSLDDLLAVVREFLNPDVSRSGLDRCLRRHGVGNLRDLKVKAARHKHSGFKAYEPGYIHIDVKYLPHLVGSMLCMRLPGSEWLIKPLAGICLSRLIGPLAGSLSASITTRLRPMRVAFCGTWSAPARCASALFCPPLVL